MENTLRELMNNGYLIWKDKGEYYLQKISTSANPKDFIPTASPPHTNKKKFHTFEMALEEANRLMHLVRYSAVVCYNRGLGQEVKNLPNIEASSVEEAHKQAEKLAAETLSNWIEIRIKPT